MTVLYLEDLQPGQRYSGQSQLRIEADDIKAFASAFDPQPFHLDADAANTTIFKGLAASGWHTAAVTMRLLLESELRLAGGIVGRGFESITWPLPVRPGDDLRVECEVLEVFRSKTKPDRGTAKLKTTTFNQDSQVVQVSVGSVVVPCRSPN